LQNTGDITANLSSGGWEWLASGASSLTPLTTLPSNVTCFDAVNGYLEQDLQNTSVDLLRPTVTGTNVWSISAKLLTSSIVTSAPAWGLCAWNASTDKQLIYFYYGTLPATTYQYVQRYTSNTTISATELDYGSTGTLMQWLRMYADGNTIWCQCSSDGLHWHTFYSEAVGAWTSPNYYGFVLNCNSTTTGAFTGMKVLNLSVS
jgi:hypothetical protein